jgi:cyclophilin family peptidyl-prolyl cis-trans isomerase
VISHPVRRLAAPILALSLAATVAACGAAASPSPSPAASAAASGAQSDCPTSQPEPLGKGQTRHVTLDTRLGQIVIAVKADLSPIAAGNFVALAGCGFYDGTVFHRVVPDFVIQGGGRPDGPGYTIQDEPVTTTYHRSTVAMARTDQPNSVDSQFFIVLSDAATPALARYNTYQIIGEVTSGMNTVDAIAASADQENPTDPIEIKTATVTTP